MMLHMLLEFLRNLMIPMDCRIMFGDFYVTICFLWYTTRWVTTHWWFTWRIHLEIILLPCTFAGLSRLIIAESNGVSWQVGGVVVHGWWRYSTWGLMLGVFCGLLMIQSHASLCLEAFLNCSLEEILGGVTPPVWGGLIPWGIHLVAMCSISDIIVVVIWILLEGVALLFGVAA